MGGKLAEPRKQTTNDFIVDVAKEKGSGIELWIGINDIVEEGAFVYGSNGAQITWTNWGQSQPDGEEHENCVCLNEGKWWDLNCDYSKPFVCERIIQGMYD